MPLSVCCCCRTRGFLSKLSERLAVQKHLFKVRGKAASCHGRYFPQGSVEPGPQRDFRLELLQVVRHSIPTLSPEDYDFSAEKEVNSRRFLMSSPANTRRAASPATVSRAFSIASRTTAEGPHARSSRCSFFNGAVKNVHSREPPRLLLTSATNKLHCDFTSNRKKRHMLRQLKIPLICIRKVGNVGLK